MLHSDTRVSTEVFADLNTSARKPSSVGKTVTEGGDSQFDQQAHRNTHKRTRVDYFERDFGLTFWGRVKLSLKNTWHSLLKFHFFLQLTWVDFRARTGTYVLSFCSVLFVVMLCVAMLSVLSSLPAVFMRLGESDAGEADLVLRPGGQMTAAPTLNYRAVVAALRGAPAEYQLHTPRTEFEATALLLQDSNATDVEDLWYRPGPDNTTTNRTIMCSNGCFSSWYGSRYGSQVQVMAINQTNEAIIGFGVDFDAPIPGKGEAVISSQVAGSLLVELGDTLVVYADISDTFAEPMLRMSPGSRNGNIILPLRVIAFAPDYAQKFPSSDAFVLVNYDAMVEMIAEALNPHLNATDRAAFAAVPTTRCSTGVYFRVPSDQRFKLYVNTNFNTIRRRMVAWANGLTHYVGYNQVSASTPILSFLSSMQFFTVFVGLIMSIIIVALAFLSIVLIYSLLTVGIETRTYELGIQRMIGFTRENLVTMVLTNAYFFTIPAWLCGLAAGQAVYTLLRVVLAKLVDVNLNRFVSGSSIGWASMAGLLIPLVAAIFPILSLITLKLPDALNVTRGRSTGVVYKLVRGDAAELNGTMLGLGILAAVFGFLIYYLFPISLLTMNLALMFYIFFGVLLGMLAGLVLLSTNFERVVETVVAYAFLFWEGKAVFRMVLKSLAAHRLRNRKTTLMYALSLGFVIFITVAFQIQMKSMTYSTRRTMAAEVLIDFRSYGRLLDNMMDLTTSSTADGAVEVVVDQLSESAIGSTAMMLATPQRFIYLDDFAEVEEYLQPFVRAGVITGITYRLRSLSGGHMWPVQSVYLETPGRYASTTSNIAVVPPGFFDVAFRNFIILDRYNDDVRDYGLSDALYTVDGLSRLIVSTTLYRTFAFRGLDDVGVVISSNWRNMSALNSTTERRSLLFQPAASMDTSPTFSMSKYPGSMGEPLCSVPGALRLSGADYSSVLTMPIQAFFLRVPNPDHYGRVKRALSQFYNDRGMYPSWNDIESSMEDLNDAGNILNIFFIFTQVMILIICFFSLMSSMTTNVLSSSKEIGILLCMGMSHFQIYRVYVFEAFVLVISSGILGFIVGIVVGYTMQLQNMMFTQLEMPFAFPWVQLLIVVGVGLLSAIAASCGPVGFLLGQPSITHILRRTLN